MELEGRCIEGDITCTLSIDTQVSKHSFPPLSGRSLPVSRRRLPEGRSVGRERGLLIGVGVDCLGSLEQGLFSQDNVGVEDAAVHRAHLRALRPTEEANALGASILIDLVHVLALADAMVRTHRHASGAIDTGVGYRKRHREITLD